MGSMNKGETIMRTQGQDGKAIQNYYRVEFFNIDEDGKGFDIPDLEEKCRILKPKLLLIPSDVFPVLINYKKLKEICKEFKVILAADISEIALLLSVNKYGDEENDPFMHCDVIYSNTQSSLGGPRGGFLAVNNTKNPGLFQKINSAVFPGLQGGPHNNQIGSLAVQLQGLINSQSIKFVSKALNNSRVLAQTLTNCKVPLFGNGTETHLVAIDCEKTGLPCEFISDILIECKIRHTYRKFGRNKSSIMFGTLVYTFREGNSMQIEVLGELISQCIRIGSEIYKRVQESGISGETKQAQLSQEISRDPRLKLILNKVSGIANELGPIKFD
ncbi:Serine hydroxymethyltransferase [Cryptosporidium felis]|nr:Serine hydroxymethyltransferase [Cryptosporidium felis]